jgi:protoporphyrin/coproporphyrin ferrochelatase
MSGDGVRRVVGVLAAAHRSYSGCTQYRENVADGFISANVERVLDALQGLPADVRWESELVFTAHSIPVSMAERYPYQRQLEESCAAVAAGIAQRLGSTEQPRWRLVYQSRSGRPEDPWLGPDICDHLRQTAADGVRAVVLCPIGFICDHIEVLYDLDVEAAAVARELGITLSRAAAVNDDPRFIGALADAVVDTIRRYEGGIPLSISPPIR